MSGYSLMIHGGAGVIRNPERFEPSLHRIVSAAPICLSAAERRATPSACA
jgi:hypothetical protein